MMQESEYKNNIQQLIDLCNLVKMQSILHRIHDHKDNNNLVDMAQKSKIISKILSKSKESEIKKSKKSQAHMAQIKLYEKNQELSQYSKFSHQIRSNNSKIKKKSNKFEKCSKTKSEIPLKIHDNELKQYAYQTPNKEQEKLQDSKLSLKQLIRQEQILNDIGKISQSHLNSPNKSSQSHLYKQYYRSQSTSPKHIVKVKTPNQHTIGKQEYSTPIKQFSQFTQHHKQKQIDSIKHRANLWPTRKKEDIIQMMEESNRKKQNVMHQNNSPHQSTAKSNKNAKNSQVVKQNGTKQQSSVSLSKNKRNIKQQKSGQKPEDIDIDIEQNDDIHINVDIEEHEGKIKIPETKPKKTNKKSQITKNSQKNAEKQQKQEQKTQVQQQRQLKSKQNKQKSKHNINIDKLYIKCIGNKYLETILSDYIQSHQ